MQMQSLTASNLFVRGLRDRLPAVLRGWRLSLLLGTAALAAGVAWQWSWLAAIGVAPVLLSVGPCAAMCALGLCASKLAGGPCKVSSPGNEPSVTTAQLAGQSDTQATQGPTVHN